MVKVVREGTKVKTYWNITTRNFQNINLKPNKKDSGDNLSLVHGVAVRSWWEILFTRFTTMHQSLNG